MDNEHIEDSVILTRRVRYAEFVVTFYAAVALEIAYRALAWFDSMRSRSARTEYFAFADRVRSRRGADD